MRQASSSIGDRRIMMSDEKIESLLQAIPSSYAWVLSIASAKKITYLHSMLKRLRLHRVPGVNFEPCPNTWRQ